MEYEEVSGGFLQQKLPVSSTDITYEIIFNASSAKYERVISSVINKKFGKRGHLSSMGANGALNPNKPFYFEQVQKFDSSSMLFIQKTIIFKVTDVFLSAEGEMIESTVKPINTIKFTVQTTRNSTHGVEITVTDT